MACCSCFGPGHGPSSGFSPNGKKYSRELQSFSNLIYDAGNQDEGRLGGFGSTTGLLRRRTGSDGQLGRTSEQHMSAVDNLQATLKDMSYHERDKLLRTDVLLLAPVVRELFPELPETHYTYVLPYADDLDEKASNYLYSVLESIRLDQGSVVVPLQTTGDGNCLLHAASRGLWGVELFSDLLRQKVHRELEEHQAWYESKVTHAEVSEAIEQVRLPHRFLSNLHIVALAHVLRRPVILYASHRDVLDYGCGYYGMAGMFGPLRYDPNSWYPRPLAIGWASQEHNHFVPLVWSASQSPVEWPVQDEGPHAPQLSRSKSFDLHDHFAVPPTTRARLRSRARGTPLARPVFVQRLVEQIRQQVVQLQGHMLAQMLDSGAFNKSAHEEEVAIQPPPASSIDLAFPPYQEQLNSLANGQRNAFHLPSSLQYGFVTSSSSPPAFAPQYFDNPLQQSETASDSPIFDPFIPSPGNSGSNQLPRSGTSYTDSAPVSWQPPRQSSQGASRQPAVRHTNFNSHVPPGPVPGKVRIDPLVYRAKQSHPSPTLTAPELETGLQSTSRPPYTPKSGSILTPLSELNPLTTNAAIAAPGRDDSPNVNELRGPANEDAQSPNCQLREERGRRTSEEPLAGPVVKRTARTLSAEPSNAHRRWKMASTAVQGAVRMKRAALAVRVDLPEGFKGSEPWWRKDGGKLRVTEGEDPFVRAQAISRSLTKRARASDRRSPKSLLEGSAKMSNTLAVPQAHNELMRRTKGNHISMSETSLRDEKGRLVWVSLAKQIMRKREGVTVADAALHVLAKPCPVGQYAAAAACQPQLARLAATTVRLAAELRLLTARPLPGIRVSLPNEDDLFLWHATLEGPPGTPWAGMSLQLEVHVPQDYPRKPPGPVRFVSKVSHPDVNADSILRLAFLNAEASQIPSSNRNDSGSNGEQTSAPSAAGLQAPRAARGSEQAEGEARVHPRGDEQAGGEHEKGETREVGTRFEDGEVVAEAARLLSAASSSAGDGTTGLPRVQRCSQESKLHPSWDPYQGMAFTLKTVQELLATAQQ